MTSKPTPFSTRVIHSGQQPDPSHGGIMPSICMTSTYAQASPGQTKGYDYTRAGNPNFTQLEGMLAALENAQHATVFSSGLGAMTAILSTFSSGDRIVAAGSLYGGTFRLFKRVFEKFGLLFYFAAPHEVASALKEKTKMLFFETPTNPLLEIVDIAELCAHAKRHGAMSCVDNTFATPYFQNPIDLGADVVVHSTTKYLGGHSDVIGGAVMTNNAAMKKELDFARMAVGVNPSPFDAWLTLRGIKTLALRMERHQENALMIAKALQKHPKVKKVYYPGLPEHPNHAIAKKQMRGYSGIVSVEFAMDIQQAKKMISAFEVFTLAESLGGVESLVCHPATMTHASIPREERLRMGLSDGLIRFSAGIEDGGDLVKDIETALSKF